MTSVGPIRIGTRGSRLALWQAERARALLTALPDAPPVELVVISTRGDRVVDRALHQVGGTALFTAEIERALLESEVDVAVHSLKDLPTRSPPGLEIGAVLERADPRDALVSRDDRRLDELPPAARVGTSSLRRGAQLRRLRPDLQVVDLRGNVPTRVSRVDDGTVDAAVLASAGLDRLALTHRIAERLEPGRFLPAPAQGAVALQIRTSCPKASSWVRRLDHRPTRLAVEAERSFLQTVEGGCQAPVGALATLDDERIRLAGLLADPQGVDVVEGVEEGLRSEGMATGRRLAARLLERGGAKIIDALRDQGEPPR